ncbi:MAG: apolipoprotein acyltransferase [Rhodobacteraceae bacterium]|nr:apolipoprotein acyltransferase [Paracoccaceae bacterium]
MIGVVTAVLGAMLGWMRARKLGGNRLDCLQYASVFAIIGFVLGLGVTIALDHQGVF